MTKKKKIGTKKDMNFQQIKDKNRWRPDEMLFNSNLDIPSLELWNDSHFQKGFVDVQWYFVPE